MSNFTVPGCNRGGKSRYLNGSGSLLLSRAPIGSDDLLAFLVSSFSFSIFDFRGAAQ